MKRHRKTKKQFLRALEKMRQELEELEACRLEYQNIQKRYNRLLESAPDAMVFVSKDGLIVRVNAQTENLFGYSEEELVGKELTTLIPERFRERHRRNVEAYFANPRVRPMGTNLEIYALKKDGSEFPADISLSPLEVDGEIFATAAVRDITEKKRAKDQIELNYHIQRVIGSALKISLEPVPLEEQLDRILELTLTLPALASESKGLIYLASDESGVLALKAQHGFSETEPPPCEKLARGRCICGREAPACATMHADCAVERQDIRYEGDFPQGHYCVPIFRERRRLV